MSRTKQELLEIWLQWLRRLTDAELELLLEKLDHLCDQTGGKKRG